MLRTLLLTERGNYNLCPPPFISHVRIFHLASISEGCTAWWPRNSTVTGHVVTNMIASVGNIGFCRVADFWTERLYFVFVVKEHRQRCSLLVENSGDAPTKMSATINPRHDIDCGGQAENCIESPARKIGMDRMVNQRHHTKSTHEIFQQPVIRSRKETKSVVNQCDALISALK